MLYLNENNIKTVGIDWVQTIDVIRNAVKIQYNGDFSQPIKPYLRYGNMNNRIIAMPAYIGGNIKSSGIKWISSFPENIKKGIPRASSVVVLNEFDTGTVSSIINTSLISIIRTASVSGYMIEEYEKIMQHTHINVGIVGFGPIGKYHYEMCKNILGDRISKIFLYDCQPIRDSVCIYPKNEKRVNICNNWQDVYKNSDIFICCTVSEKPYINLPPKEGSLILNVSLRDFCEDTFQFFNKCIIVDDWDEVCRENTTIDLWNQQFDLKQKDTYCITDVFDKRVFEKSKQSMPIMFCPMGMAIYDIAIAKYYLDRCMGLEEGLQL